MDGKKRKKFNLFDVFNSQRIGKGVEKGEVKDPNFKNFFKYFGRSFTRLLNVNLMFTFFCLPLFFALFAIAGYFDNNAADVSHPLASVLNGFILSGEINPLTMSLYGVYGIKDGMASQISVASLIFYGISGLTLFTWGYANAGMAYTLRNMMRGDPVFVWSDFFRTAKKNLGQALLVGLLDASIIGLLYYNMRFYSLNSANTVFYFMYIATIFFIAIYAVMRIYIYIMLVTFKLGTFKLFKNAFIFTFAGIKRNILGLLGMVLAIAINAFLVFVFLPLGAILPFILTVAVCSYIGTYAAYPKIKEVMIDPYYDEYGNPLSDSSFSENAEKDTE